jgi:GNAT superfamily N-acetyltransferase
VTLADISVLHKFYSSSRRYFEIIAAPLPTIEDVTRQLEFYLFAGEVVAYLDTTLDYPKAGDATVNLLLVAEQKQHLGLGSKIMQRLEKQLEPKAKRILAGVFGHNPGAVRFWERLGYHFAVDARPVLSWYAKDLEQLVVLAAPQKEVALR